MSQPENLVVFSVWLTQAVTLLRSSWWQVCECTRDSTQDKPCPRWWLRSGNSLIRLHHEEQHCWIGKNERSLLEVLKTGRGVGECSPKMLTQKQLSDLGVAWSIVWDDMKKDSNVRPYHPTFVNELSDGNMDRRYESCRALLDTFSNAVSHSKVLFSDKCAIYRSALFATMYCQVGLLWLSGNCHCNNMLHFCTSEVQMCLCCVILGLQ